MPHFRAIEGALYDLGQRPDARPASPRPFSPTPIHPERPHPRGPSRESVRRLDLSIAAKQLSPEEQQLVREHYILRVRPLSRRQRAPIIYKLISILDR
jgi:hypothetical protein